jgi:hypothetical protein
MRVAALGRRHEHRFDLVFHAGFGVQNDILGVLKREPAAIYAAARNRAMMFERTTRSPPV